MAAVASPLNQEREDSRPLTNALLRNNIGRSSKSEEWYRADLSQESTITKHSAGSLRFDVQDQESSHQLATKDASVREAKAPPLLSIMESYGHASEIPTESSWWPGVLALVVLFLVGIVGVAGGFWWSHRQSTAPAATMAPTMAQGALLEKTPTKPTSKSPNASDPSNKSADEEFHSLLDRQTKEDVSDSTDLSAAYADGEKKYPNDYRFSYERGKLSIVGFATHHEAFGALALAAEKAIDNGKAQEMLDSLMADQDADFYKLSRGHREWQILQEALRNKDKTRLQALHH